MHWQRHLLRESHTLTDVCVQIALLTAPRSSSRSQSQQQQQQDTLSSPANLAAIIAPSVVGGCLLAAAAAYGLFVLRRRHRGGSDADPYKGGLLPITNMHYFSTGGTGGTRQSGYSGPDRTAEPPLGSLDLQPPFRCVSSTCVCAMAGALWLSGMHAVWMRMFAGCRPSYLSGSAACGLMLSLKRT
jgi:hypothetical protein